MVIESYEKSYQVISQDGSYPDRELYTCVQEGSSLRYRVIQIKDHELMLKVLQFLIEEQKKGTFEDLKDVFTSGEELNVVFTAVRGIRIREFMENEPSLEERIRVGHNVLEKLVLYDMPAYFMCQSLAFDHLYIEEDLTIYFDHTLEGISEYSNYTLEQANMYRYQLLGDLFKIELGRKTIDAMAQYLKNLLRGQYSDSLEVFKEYEQAAQLTLAIPKEELLIPKTRLFRIWQGIKKLGGIVKKVIFVLIYLGAFGYMIYCLWSCNKVDGYTKTFDSIGTMTIKECQEAE